MKIHAQEILKRNLQFLMFVGLSLFCLASGALSISALLKNDKTMIIAIDANGTRIVTETLDPIYKTEAISFIQKFFFNTYNFEASNFFKRIGYATTVMSEDLWKRKESEILDLKARVERDHISLSGQVQRLTQSEDGTYHALIHLQEQNRLAQNEHQLKVSLRLKKVPRTQENPYGLEVDSYEETLVR